MFKRIKKKVASFTFKITVLYTALLGAFLITFSLFLYFTLRYSLYTDLDNELNKKAESIQKTIQAYHNLSSDEELSIVTLKKVLSFNKKVLPKTNILAADKDWILTVDLLDLRRDFISIYPKMKQGLIIRSKVIPDKIKTQADPDLLKTFNIRFKKRKFRLINYPARIKNKEYTIQVITSLKPLINILENRLLVIFISIPILLFISAFMGNFFAKRLLKPVFSIISAANKITYKDLNSRVEEKKVDDEMLYLVRSFNNMIERLEHSFSYISEFSTHIAHELKTPLAIIQGESDLLLRKERDINEYKRVIKLIASETTHIQKTIEELSLFTSIDYSPDSLNTEIINLNDFLEEVIEITQVIVSEKTIHFESFLSDDDLLIEGHPLHLRRVLLNLIDNAVKYNKEQGYIAVSLKKEDSFALIKIKDKGIGIAKENIEKIFSPFYRAKNVAEKISGSGLGLSIARSIIINHQGTISASSFVGKGSEFTIRLPLKDQYQQIILKKI